MATVSPRPLTVLITSVWLDNRGGVASAIRDITQGLLRRGHRPIVYSPHLGDPAHDLRRHGVAVVDDLSLIAEAPDVIHGQHLIQTAEALLRFPGTPAIQMCHAFLFWQEGPARFPQIYRYVAVDQAVRDRLVHTEGVAPEQVEVIHNAVDLARFPARPAPLPKKPARALAFTKSPAHLPLIEAACRRHGIALEVLGRGGGRVTSHPEAELVKYDLVFGAARTALEALTAGCAVVVCDQRGLAGMATCANLPQLRPLNFGLRSLVHPVSVDRLADEIARYDAEDATQAALQMRSMASVEPVLDRLLQLYAEAMAQPAPDEAALRAAHLAFLHQNLPRRRADNRWPWMIERQQLTARIAQLERELAAARRAAPE
jgi:glycosyl transferase family 4